MATRLGVKFKKKRRDQAKAYSLDKKPKADKVARTRSVKAKKRKLNRMT